MAHTRGYHAGAMSPGNRLIMWAKSTKLCPIQAKDKAVSVFVGSQVMALETLKKKPTAIATSKPVPAIFSWEIPRPT